MCNKAAFVKTFHAVLETVYGRSPRIVYIQKASYTKKEVLEQHLHQIHPCRSSHPHPLLSTPCPGIRHDVVEVKIPTSLWFP
jgi:hypothetical protein